MKKLVFIFWLVLISGIIFSCRKDKPAGIYVNLPGNWKWIGSDCSCCELPFNPQTAGFNYRLEIEKEGKYKLYKNSKKVEHGRMQLESAHYYFRCDDFSKSNNLINDKFIVSFANDTLKIDMGSCDSGSDYIFIKE